MPMDRVTLREALNRREFHRRLKEWLENTDDPAVGPEGYGQNGLVHVSDGESIFKLNTDTKRHGVQAYMQLLAQHGDGIDWHVTTSQRGNSTAVTYGPNRLHISGFYLYLVGDVP